MQLIDYEKAVLSLILREEETDIPYLIAAELDADKFSTTEHKKIYEAIQTCIVKKNSPSTANVSLALGSDIESITSEYLIVLHRYLDTIKSSNDGWEGWVRLIDNAGRLRHLGLVLGEYRDKYKDFEKLVQEVKDVDEFISRFFEEINAVISQVQTSYKPLTKAIEKELRRLELEKEGFVVDVLPTGMPSFESYFVPRPRTLGILAGISSMGKTQLSLQILVGVAIQLYENNLPGCVCINEFETEGMNLVRRLACALAMVDSQELASGKLKGTKLRDYEKVIEYLADLPIYYDDTPKMTTTQMTWQAIALSLKTPRVLGVSDYLELFADEAYSEELRVSTAIRNVRRLAWETGSSELVLSQFNNSVMMTDSKMGGTSRTRYSGAVSQAADWFIEIWNPVEMEKKGIDFIVPDGFSRDRAYALILKNKEYATGVIELEWISKFTRFRDLTLPKNEIYKMPLRNTD